MMQQPGAQSAFDYSQLPQNTDFGNFDFSQYPIDQSFQDPSLNDPNAFAAGLNASQAPAYGSNLAPVAPSTDLVRRARNHQLAPQVTQQQDQWNGGYNNMSGQNDDENEQELEKKVALAKRDAQGKRKQIPPFVQKLSRYVSREDVYLKDHADTHNSFLDSGHTTLIRWSDDGRSFIVLDEDEFARTLIPELFKHNNYASFVRQLNMYGFHKTVNITDGSLRQSEKARKGVKPPSMYSHPYFRRNRPDLLWLIQKPASKSGAKRKRDGTVKADDSEDERSFSPVPENRPPGELGITGAGSDLAPLPRNEISAVRRELQKLQQHQKYISDMITQLKQQNDTFYRQATAFQALHDRHENSINAILTFLATFYNRSMEGQAGQNLVNMFSNMAQQSGQQTGSVVEDFTEAPEGNNTMQRFKRPQLLLPAPNVAPVPQFQNLSGMAQTAPNSTRTSTSPINGDRSTRTPSARPASAQPPHTSSTSPQVKNDAPTPDMLQAVPDSDQMMNLINGVNATNATEPSTAAPSFDFNSALDHYQNANGNSPLTPQQRDDMLAMISNSQGGSNNNALVSPTPPAMPDMNQFKETQKQLEILTNLQKSQDSKVHELSRRLQPLSPTGTIPGVADANEGGGFFDPTGAPGEFDPSNFINFDNENDLNFNFDNDDGQIDWDFGAAANPASASITYQNTADEADSSMLQPEPAMDGGGRVESVSSGATSPAGDEYVTPDKRARTS